MLDPDGIRPTDEGVLVSAHGSDNSSENIGEGSGEQWRAQGISQWARHGLEEMAERGQMDRAEQGLPDDTWVGLLSDVQQAVAEAGGQPTGRAADDAEHYGSGAGSSLPIDRSQESGKVV